MVMEEDFDGLDTLEAIQRQNPSQKTIMVSGHSATGRAMAAQEKGAKWLAKDLDKFDCGKLYVPDTNYGETDV